ncbi:hypothetical protein L6164_033362 [Bauhinia variegata]|uniref:Uncharacterized protein n=1 Tax=Bauhinia variegata TaxID=167791 RepID=A0ACB9KRP8_BAUVA|nr:hypothetical protein L6164_033362 [Bauhinia variegata]
MSNKGQNEGKSPEPFGPFGMSGSSSTNNRSASFLQGEIDLNLEYKGDNSFNPNETETKNSSNSSDPVVVIQSGISEYVVEENGEHDRSGEVICLSCKRRSPENDLRELSIGESSKMAEEARTHKRRAAINEGSTSYSLNTSAVRYTTGPEIRQPQQFEARTGQGTRGPTSGTVAYPSLYGPVSGRPLSNAPAYVNTPLSNAPAYVHTPEYHISSANMSNAPGWFRSINFAQEYVQISPNIVNRSAGAFSIGSHRHSSHRPLLPLYPSRLSPGMVSSNRFVNRTFQNQQMSVVDNIEPPFTLWPRAESIDSVLSEARHALQIHYNSISALLQLQELLALQEQIGDESTGLSEEDIMMHLKQENFVCITERIPTNESCCICQEEYADGQNIGRLNCDHKFHFSCIKEWLGLKNTCPLCKCTALVVPPVEDHDG